MDLDPMENSSPDHSHGLCTFADIYNDTICTANSISNMGPFEGGLPGKKRRSERHNPSRNYSAGKRRKLENDMCSPLPDLGRAEICHDIRPQLPLPQHQTLWEGDKVTGPSEGQTIIGTGARPQNGPAGTLPESHQTARYEVQYGDDFDQCLIDDFITWPETSETVSGNETNGQDQDIDSLLAFLDTDSNNFSEPAEAFHHDIPSPILGTSDHIEESSVSLTSNNPTFTLPLRPAQGIGRENVVGHYNSKTNLNKSDFVPEISSGSTADIGNPQTPRTGVFDATCGQDNQLPAENLEGFFDDDHIEWDDLVYFGSKEAEQAITSACMDRQNKFTSKAAPSSDLTTPAPFVRPAFPNKVLDRSNVTGVTTSVLMQTCFRIGEALNAHSRCRRSNQQVVLELFCRVGCSFRESLARIQHFHFSDLFTDRDPSLTGTLTGWKTGSLLDRQAIEFIDEPGKLCRCVCKMERNGHAPAGWSLDVLSVRQTDWEEIQWVLRIISRDG